MGIYPQGYVFVPKPQEVRYLLGPGWLAPTRLGAKDISFGLDPSQTPLRTQQNSTATSGTPECHPVTFDGPVTSGDHGPGRSL